MDWIFKYLVQRENCEQYSCQGPLDKTSWPVLLISQYEDVSSKTRQIEEGLKDEFEYKKALLILYNSLECYSLIRRSYASSF